MSEPAGFATLALLVERLIAEVQALGTRLEARAMPAPAKATEPEGLWDAEDLAAFLACSKSWVYDSEAAGKLPSLHIGGMLRFEPDAIRRLVRGGRTGAKVIPLHYDSKCNTNKP